MIESKIKNKSNFNNVFKTSRHQSKKQFKEKTPFLPKIEPRTKETDRQTGLIPAGGNKIKGGKRTPELLIL